MSTEDQTTVTFRAMATDVTLTVVRPGRGGAAALSRAQAVFERVEAACTRFVETSPLMLANADPRRWHDVPPECARAVAEAFAAYEETAGVFDPRILDALVTLGYDRSVDASPGRGPAARHASATRPADGTPAPSSRGRASLARPWRPRWEIGEHRCRLHLDGARIDLGGIGKGLAVRWAADELRDAGTSAMVEAGGDCQFLGAGPDETGWRVGMEDPRGGRDPLLVFELTAAACATSSIRLRHWTRNGREVHHLVDPRTGTSGGAGLLAVTVLHSDPAWAEVWSKTLFLHGRAGIAAGAARRALAAAWVEEDGCVHVNRWAAPSVIWAAPRVRWEPQVEASGHV